MFEIQNLLIFIAAGLALNLSPGPDMLFCLTQGATGGPRVGFWAAMGIATGSLVHTFAAAIGVAALLSQSPAAFTAITVLGAIYLCWLAWQALKAAYWVKPLINTSALQPQSDAWETRQGASSFAAWRKGTMINILNPKVALFFLAFLPQFVDQSQAGQGLGQELEQGTVFWQFIILGIIFNVNGTIINAAVGSVGGFAAQRWLSNRTARRVFYALSAVIFLLLALRLLWPQG